MTFWIGFLLIALIITANSIFCFYFGKQVGKKERSEECCDAAIKIIRSEKNKKEV